MSKGNLANTKIRQPLRKYTSKGTFYSSVGVSYDPSTKTLTYEVEGRTKTVVLSDENAKTYVKYFSNCKNGYAIDYFVKHGFKLSNETYKILKLSVRYSTPAEVSDYIKDIKTKFNKLVELTGQEFKADVRKIRKIIDDKFIKNNNTRISVIHDIFFPDIRNESARPSTDLIEGKYVKLYTSQYTDNIYHKIFADDSYDTHRLLKVEALNKDKRTVDYLASYICRSICSTARSEKQMANMLLVICVATMNTAIVKNTAGCLYFPVRKDALFTSTLSEVYNINTEEIDNLIKDDKLEDVIYVNNMYYKLADYSWFTSKFNSSYIDDENYTKFKGVNGRDLYSVKYKIARLFNYSDDRSREYAISSVIEKNLWDTINTDFMNMEYNDIETIINRDIIKEEDRRITEKFMPLLVLSFLTKSSFNISQTKNIYVDSDVMTAYENYNERHNNILMEKMPELFKQYFNKSAKDLNEEEKAAQAIDEQIDTGMAKLQQEEDKQENEQPQQEEPKQEEPKQQPQEQQEQPNAGISKRKLKKMGLSKRQINKIYRIIDKSKKSGVTENDTLNEIKELLKVLVGKTSPGKETVADKPIDKVASTKHTPLQSEITEAKSRLKPTPIKEAKETTPEINLKYEIENFNKNKLKKTMEGLARLFKKGDIEKPHLYNIIKKYKFNPITAHLIKMVGTNQKPKKYMGGIFSKIASVIPYGSQIYDVAKKVYNVAKPLIEKAINKYDDAYKKKMNGYLSKSKLKSYLVENQKPKLSELSKVLK